MSAFNRLSASSKKLDHAANALMRLDIPPSQMKGYIDQAVSTIRPTVVGYLLANYSASGINNDTGQTRGAIARSIIFLKNGSLVVMMPRGITRSDDTRPEAEYVIAASLSAGAVRDGGLGISGYGKRQIKKGNAKYKARNAAVSAGIKSGSGISVTRATDFYKLNSSQKLQARALFDNALRRLLEAYYRRAS